MYRPHLKTGRPPANLSTVSGVQSFSKGFKRLTLDEEAGPLQMTRYDNAPTSPMDDILLERVHKVGSVLHAVVSPRA